MRTAFIRRPEEVFAPIEETHSFYAYHATIFHLQETYHVGATLGGREIGWIGDGFHTRFGDMEERDLSGAHLQYKSTRGIAETGDIIDALNGKSAARTHLAYISQIMNARGGNVPSAVDGRVNLAFAMGTDKKLAPVRWLVEKGKCFIDAADLKRWPPRTRVFF